MKIAAEDTEDAENAENADEEEVGFRLARKALFTDWVSGSRFAISAFSVSSASSASSAVPIAEARFIFLDRRLMGLHQKAQRNKWIA